MLDRPCSWREVHQAKKPLRHLASALKYTIINLCNGSIVVNYSGLWTRRSLVQVPNECQYSMKLDRLHGAYPILRSFGVVSYIGICRAAAHKSCNWGMQIDWWLQPRAVFDHTSSGISWHTPCDRNKSQLNCMTLSRAQTEDSIH